MALFGIYMIASAIIMIAGIIVMIIGFSTKRKPLKLAGIVISISAFQVLVIFGIIWALAFWGSN